MLDERTDDGREVNFAERYFTEPAPVRHLPEHSRDPRVALSFEGTDDEISWSSGEMISATAVAKAFKTSKER